MDGLANIAGLETADDNDEPRVEYEDIPDAEFAFLRNAVAKLSGGWTVVEFVDAPEENHRAVKRAAIDPDKHNKMQQVSYLITKLDGGYQVYTFRDDLPIDHPDACADIDSGDTIQETFASVARHLFDPLTRPRLEHLQVLFSYGADNGADRRTDICEVRKANEAWSARSIPGQPMFSVTGATTMEAAIEGLARAMWPDGNASGSLLRATIFMGCGDASELSTPPDMSNPVRRGVSGGWQGCMRDDWEKYGPTSEMIDEAMMAAWDLESATMALRLAA